MLCQCHNLSTFSTIQLLPRCFVDLKLSCQIDVIFLPFFFFFFFLSRCQLRQWKQNKGPENRSVCLLCFFGIVLVCTFYYDLIPCGQTELEADIITLRFDLIFKN